MVEHHFQVEEAPRTIGDLLHTLALFVINATQYATQKQFEVTVGEFLVLSDFFFRGRCLYY